jgi:hypothetical protein
MTGKQGKVSEQVTGEQGKRSEWDNDPRGRVRLNVSVLEQVPVNY